MKRTEIKRKTPLKSGSMNQNSTFKRKAPMPVGDVKMARSIPKKRTPMKSRGMTGIARTTAQIAFHDALAGLGCIACVLDGHENMSVSIHHIDGRTKPDAHWLVLPLCAGHHQDGTGEDKTMIAVHPYKKRFENRYGTQLELLELCKRMLEIGI